MNFKTRALLISLLLAGCRTLVEAKYPNGKPKVMRTYGPLGGKTPANLKREQTFYYNGKPERDAHYRKGVLHGPYLDYWHNGQKKSQGRYVDGKKQGPWEYSYNQYAVATKGEFKDDLKEGPWIELYENGALKAEGEYRQGRETGLWKRWAPKGDLVVENACFEANPEGRYLTYHANKTPKEDYLCRHGVPVGPYVKKNMDGDVEERGAFDSTGKRDGVWETFHPGKAPASRRTYRSGVDVDSLLAWDPAGRVRERGFFRKGIGEVTYYDSLGRLVERKQMEAGRPEGEDWTYHPNGKKKSLVVYKDGQALVMKRWHANGRLASEGAFEKGKRTGEWKQFGDKGQILDLSRYQEGLLHDERMMYDSSGKLMQVMRYERGYPAEGRFPRGLKEGLKAERAVREAEVSEPGTSGKTP